MQIGKVLYPITTLGPGRRLGIWTQGCFRSCKGCSNPELQPRDPSKDISMRALFDGTRSLDYEGITVSGGEPFLDPAELRGLIELFSEAGYEDILVYTGYTIEELLKMENEDVKYVLSHIAVLIDGPFEESLVDDVPLRGSSNQRVIVLNEEYRERYASCLSEEKKVDVFRFGAETHFIGIPFKGYDELYRELLSMRKKK
ncbi:MAG: radical SAM protein [Clostridia bacterium]|nr:radical SAM protein [Clostridia bacterium]